MKESIMRVTNNPIWITWETQRRSIEMSKALRCDYFVFDYKGLLRYPKCIINTLSILFKHRNSIVFVQNPSMILAVIVCLFKYILNINVIVDRHTTFRLNKRYEFSLDYLVFRLFNKLTLRVADLTIVTNDFLASIVDDSKGKAFVLPDKLPHIIKSEDVKLAGTFNLLLISSFGEDEPIEEVFKAMDNLKRISSINAKLYISGNYNKLSESVRSKAPSNIIFTGYLSDMEYANILNSVEAIIVLTTADYCMLCGCYEAVSASKPLITSNMLVLREYFKGSVFVNNTSEDICSGIIEVINNYDIYANNIINLKSYLENEWRSKFNMLEKTLLDL